jgi:hypothetical protein
MAAATRNFNFKDYGVVLGIAVALVSAAGYITRLQGEVSHERLRRELEVRKERRESEAAVCKEVERRLLLQLGAHTQLLERERSAHEGSLDDA